MWVIPREVYEVERRMCGVGSAFLDLIILESD